MQHSEDHPENVRACSTPGGRIVVAAPCPPRVLAERARKIHLQRGARERGSSCWSRWTGGCPATTGWTPSAGHLYDMLGDPGAASTHYRSAAARTTSEPEQRYLLKQAARLRRQTR